MNRCETGRVPGSVGHRHSRFRLSTVRMAAALLLTAVPALFLVRVTGHPPLARHDERVGAYVLDAVQNGNWVVQKDFTGEIAAKPPLLTWCAAVPTLLAGHITPTAIYWPAAASLCATALVLLGAGGRSFGWRAGFGAALAYVVSPAGYTQLSTARYDGLLALMVILAALAAFKAWINGSGWTWFWLAAAVGTMAKGPLAVLLGAAGLLAFLWERRSGSPAPFRGNHLAGVLVFLLIAGGWFVLAYGLLGQPLIDKMIGRELIGHTVGSDDGPGSGGPLKPPVDFILVFAPWSLAVLWSFWRVWKRPDDDPTNRRFERFLVCGCLVGLIVFCLAGHRHSRLILPLIPFAALLAGRELARLVTPWSDRKLFRTAVVLVVLLGLGGLIEARFLQRHSSRVGRVLAAPHVSQLIAERLGADAPLTYVDSPFAVQFYLNCLRPCVSFERAAALLRGDAAAWVAVCDFASLQKQLGPDAARLHEVLRWPPAGEPWIRVLGNRPFPVTNQPVALLLGPLRVETQSFELERPRINYRREIELNVRGSAAQARLLIENQGPSPQPVQIRVLDGISGKVTTQVGRCLLPGEVWEFPNEAGFSPFHELGRPCAIGPNVYKPATTFRHDIEAEDQPALVGQAS